MITDIIAILLGSIVVLLGFIGCIVPVIPGPLLSFSGLIILSIAGGFTLYSPGLLIILGIAAAASQFLDNIFPVLASKRAGAGKAGVWGSVSGMIVGMIFFPPLGVIIGAFLGALAGEVLFNRENKDPLKAALGVFTGTLLGIVLKLIVCGIIAGFFISSIGKML
ncbi:MAG: DUF456 domain-containing protein [Spirochaetales bacterium]|nr:DUF456 domain-containing protein [Spirochaetales bacterium]